mgnify:FL=1
MYNWINNFKSGRETVEDAERSGRPSTSTTDVNIHRVRKAVENERRRTAEQLEEVLGMLHTTIHRILTEHLGMSRLVARWVPKLLSE